MVLLGKNARVEFRPLTDDDLPMLHRWLNDPAVVRWWEDTDVSWLGVVRECGSTNTDPVEHWVAVHDGVDIGWIQTYAAADFDDEDETRHWFRLGVRRTAAGIDYLIGPSTGRHRGLGTLMIDTFVTDIVFGRHPEWTEVCASPMTANVASWRALEKAGFTTRGTFFDEHGPARLMVRQRP